MNDPESVAVPKQKDLLEPVLASLSDGQIKTVDEIVSSVSSALGLPESVLNKPSRVMGKTQLKSNVEWALTTLSKKGLVSLPVLKSRIITPKGLEVLKTGQPIQDIPDIDSEEWGPSDYNPGISAEDWLNLLKDRDIFTENSLDLMDQIKTMGGETSCKQLSEEYGESPDTYNGIGVNLSKRIHKATGCPLYKENGKDCYWPILFLSKPASDRSEGKYLWKLRPELSEALDMMDDDHEIQSGSSFFEYLISKGLNYPTETVENFLLSLKAKQFLILSGGTGTGKTKLAQAYGEFISRSRSERIVKTEVTLGKSTENRGFTLNRKDFFSAILEAADLDGEYQFTIGNCGGTGVINMTPRFWFRKDEHLDEIIRCIEEMKKTSDKADLTLRIPGRSKGDTYEIVPVGSNWTDGRHITGYRNAITGDYVSTPSLELMLKAAGDPANPYMLILDEMNLSHVERYFSDMISCMESGEKVKLDSDGSDVPEQFSLGSNLFVIGTVNMDETTCMFSPKVLDRANVIEFEPVPVSDYLTSGEIGYEPQGDVSFLQDCRQGLECRKMNARTICDAIRESDPESVDSLISDLQSVQLLMQKMNLPFGYRTVDELFRFIYVAWIYEGRGKFSNPKRYMDAQILQKILPKINGNSSISEALKELLEFCRSGGYPRSAAKLKAMCEMLENRRYVSFNC